MTLSHADERDAAIAVIGMSCRAAGAETLEDLWDLVVAAEQRFTEVSKQRWRGLHDHLNVSPRASLVEGIADFDARFFGIAPRMVTWMDPQQRMALELAWHAMENAGLNPDDTAGLPIAVFASAFLSDYRDRMIAANQADVAALPGTLMTFLANRVSYQFGWTGPSLVVDSACSSSLTALSLAVQGLRAGAYPMALVVTANLTSSGFFPTTAYRGGALSASGDSVPFTAHRNGYVRGEGGACVLLKPLRAAVADGDQVQAVIKAAICMHNGRGGGLTATDVTSVETLMHQAALAAGCSVGQLGYLEAHGSGTPKGDAVEIVALSRALGDATAAAGPDGKVWVGSIKANIGHLEGASGLIGLIKTILVLQSGLIPAVAGLEEADPALAEESCLIAIAERKVPWPAQAQPRRAAVNSFGLGGTTSCVIIEEPSSYPQGRWDPPAGRARIVPLSASSENGLAELARRLIRTVDRVAPDLASLAWTAQTGRRQLPVRDVVIATDMGQLRSGLLSIAGLPAPTAGNAPKAGSAGPDPLNQGQRLAVTRWLSGEAVDWREIWDGQPEPARVALPGSPFERDTYWFEADVPVAAP